jgi:hypothetical protein
VFVGEGLHTFPFDQRRVFDKDIGEIFPNPVAFIGHLK